MNRSLEFRGQGLAPGTSRLWLIAPVGATDTKAVAREFTTGLRPGKPLGHAVQDQYHSAMRLLVLATHNKKKRLELEALLAEPQIELRTLADFPDPIEVVEDGNSFAENAALKASQQAVYLQQWALGEDSGISVTALDNRPGIYSARFSGPDATDERNNIHLLNELGDTPFAQRTAYYTCHLALADPSGEIRLTAEARCHGIIRFQPAGTAGFGYDPLFEIPEYHRTFGELGDCVKSVISHRSRAIQMFVPQLQRLIRDGGWERRATMNAESKCKE